MTPDLPVPPPAGVSCRSHTLDERILTQGTGAGIDNRVSGIFFGMFSSRDPEHVLSSLGDKFVSGLVAATGKARDDLTELRAWHPDWVNRMAERTLANLIHDRLWAHLVDAVDEIDGLVVRDEEPWRELVLSGFRIRCKRHDERNRLSNYPTREALAF